MTCPMITKWESFYPMKFHIFYTEDWSQSEFLKMAEAHCEIIDVTWIYMLVWIWLGSYHSSRWFMNILVGGLEHEWIIFPFSWEFHHPFDFHSIIFQRGRVATTNQFQSIVKWCEMVVWAVLRATFYKRVSTVDQVKPPIRHSPQGELH